MVRTDNDEELNVLKVAMAQINSTVGDIRKNSQKIRKFINKAKALECDIVIFPELALLGYPPQDLLIQTDIVEKSTDALKQLHKDTKNIVAVVGFVERVKEKLFNAAAIINDGNLIEVVHKRKLPTYDVFDEARYFTPSDEVNPISIRTHNESVCLGVEICEDLWDDNLNGNVTKELVQKGAELIIVINASPYYVGKMQERLSLLQLHAKRYHLPIFYVNLVGGQDELVFDGHSFAVYKNGQLIALAHHFKEDLVITDLNSRERAPPQIESPSFYKDEEMFHALVLGVKDYFVKTNFTTAVIGLSGGIDSSLTAAIAKEALGEKNVLGVSMPSRYTSQHSKTDAEKLAINLGIRYRAIPIQEIFQTFETTLSTIFSNLERDVTEENIQARIRGIILMAIANKFNSLVLGTGNKTELALGYCTLYGDMAAGLMAISDVSKKEVYNLARYYNKRYRTEAIPKNCFTKVPTAELREKQVDPFDYDVVSPLVDEIVENRRSKNELIRIGYDPELVTDILKRVRAAEFKRRQAAPGIKITRKSFGIGWKMPIANKYIIYE
ncbi:NAD+ synthase [[Eubacterium] cellulosolvens]